MGRKSKRKSRGGAKGDDGRKVGGTRGNDDRRGREYPEVPKEHEKLQRYYDALLDMGDDERCEFWAALRRELPNSFRFCGSKGHALAVRRLLESRYIPQIEAMEAVDGRKFGPPAPVPWYPDRLAWSMTTPKNVVRRFAPFSAFQRFLVSETSIGNISRQEEVSMIPPLLLDVRPGMVVLDMCAAPGSKATQLLEMLHAGEEARMRRFTRDHMGRAGAEKVKAGEAGEDAEESGADEKENGDVDYSIDNGDDGRATGLLIANDFDYKRSHMLVHQLKRLSSPNLLVTNHDATMYPALRVAAAPGQPARPNFLKFDRVLADVPCSGDGTLRKNANLWRDWQPAGALGLHVTQVRILVRALQLLRVGGRVVYSTCSMNPVENESVVLSAIERCGGLANVGVVDCEDRLPGLKRRPGLRSWKVMDKHGRIWSSWQEVADYVAQTGTDTPSRLAYSMFARPEGTDCADVPLERCMRLYPHLQDTGGFFITVLEKNAGFKARPEDELRRLIPRPTAAQQQQQAIDEQAKNEVLLEDPPPVQGTKRPAAADGPPEQEAKRARAEEEVPATDVQGGGAADGQGAATDIRVVGDFQAAAATDVRPDATDFRADTVLAADVGATNVQAATDEEQKETPPKSPNSTPDEDDPGPAGDDRPAPSEGKHRDKKFLNYEDPYKYLPEDDPAIGNIRKFYNVSERFPRDRFMVRNADGKPLKAIYYTSALGRECLISNEGKGVRFVHAGVRMFVRQDAPSADVCRWRIQSEGMPILEAYVGTDRVVTLTKKETLRLLLREMFPRIANGEWKRLDEIGERMRDVGMGCCVLRVEPTPAGGGDDGFEERMVMPLWKSLASLNLMLPKEDRAAMLLRLWNDTTPLVNDTLKSRQQAVAAEGEAAEEGAAADAGLDREEKEESAGENGIDVDVEDLPSP